MLLNKEKVIILSILYGEIILNYLGGPKIQLHCLYKKEAEGDYKHREEVMWRWM